MKDPTNRYLLYRGNTLLGIVTHTEDDQPVHIGCFEPAGGFVEVEALFREMAVLMQLLRSPEKQDEREKRLMQIRNEISLPGLQMFGESTGKVRFEPNSIFMEGEKIKWRGYVWHEGLRL